jgi:dephospho-CoA kinase
LKRIKIIGLTGQSGAGKSTVSDLFSQKNAEVINADLLVRELYDGGSPCLKTLAAEFGEDIIDKDGSVCRPLLAQRAFSSKHNTALLGAIVHPFVMALFLSRAKAAADNGKAMVVYDAPQLFESNADVICDCIVGVVADREKRIARICSRDKISVEAANQRINAQLDEEFFRQSCDYIITNNSDLTELDRQFEQVYQAICNPR